MHNLGYILAGLSRFDLTVRTVLNYLLTAIDYLEDV
jgi:hypothetical protein